MATVIEVDFFNSYWIQKIIGSNISGSANPSHGRPIGPGIGYPGIFFETNANNDSRNWQVEEGRIRGGYNNVSTDIGVNAFVNDPNPQQQNRFNTLIYSGLYNSRTGFNATNVFSVAEDITRSTDPANGSIQKIYAEDTNLIVFQEDKISRALIDKDTIYTTEGGTQTQSGARVIGQIVPYKGEYGISKNPESFAVYGYRKYLADRNRNAILRLSNDGITEISSYGMMDWFRDNLALISNERSNYNLDYSLDADVVVGDTVIDLETVSGQDISLGMSLSFSTDSGASFTNVNGYVVRIGVSGSTTTVFYTASLPAITKSASTIMRFTKYYKGRILGGYDVHNKNYVVSLQESPRYIDQNTSSYNTLSFDEGINGWVSFFSYKPQFSFSLANNYYTTTSSSLYEQYDDTTPNNRGNFYGIDNNANITFVFNEKPSIIKNFKTVGYEGSNGWQVDTFVSDIEQPNPFNQGFIENQDTTESVKSYEEGLYIDPTTGQPLRAGFNRKENLYVANLISSSIARAGEVTFGDQITGIKGYIATVKFSTDNSTEKGGMKELWSTRSDYVMSSY
tara:strand:- start:3116 stop:4813 length:1698 start_codon:yes stop_codon:yes gene_type:complete